MAQGLGPLSTVVSVGTKFKKRTLRDTRGVGKCGSITGVLLRNIWETPKSRIALYVAFFDLAPDSTAATASNLAL